MNFTVNKENPHVVEQKQLVDADYVLIRRLSRTEENVCEV